jgi:hypothetical protein
MLRSIPVTSLFLALTGLVACTTPTPPTAAPAPVASTPSNPAPSGAPEWLATDTLFAVMGGVKDLTVADLFAGDGTYTLRLLDAGARVIAIDTDAAALEALAAQARQRGFGPDRLTTRVTTPGVPGITPGEVDRALCTRTFLTIQDRIPFFTAVKAGLRPKGQLIIVDFLPEQTPMGPPVDLRVTVEQVMDELEPCGFTDIGGYSKKIPYRFIIQAMEFDPGTLPAE